MTKENDLKEEQRLKFFAEGKEAAELGRSPLVCPYIQDLADFRFLAWLDGYRSLDNTSYSEPASD